MPNLPQACKKCMCVRNPPPPKPAHPPTNWLIQDTRYKQKQAETRVSSLRKKLSVTDVVQKSNDSYIKHQRNTECKLKKWYGSTKMETIESKKVDLKQQFTSECEKLRRRKEIEERKEINYPLKVNPEQGYRKFKGESNTVAHLRKTRLRNSSQSHLIKSVLSGSRQIRPNLTTGCPVNWNWLYSKFIWTVKYMYVPARYKFLVDCSFHPVSHS